MLSLIGQIRSHIPFDEMNEARVCGGLCMGCPKKLLEYLEQEVEWWEGSVNAGDEPSLGDVEKLARSSKKIYKVLQKNQVL
ncbi:hypothetical protein BCF53_11559 [Reinekea marinisedimentorum]|uniref:Uncharacterized protein n=2 Tax=Reinekea marinisedimentorum TaxID=230495 RepID=A0A4R3I2B6_9GAMM|nr:hypothetical protein BCF53_11559 [Reinekea marinisedimentorum]